MEEEQTWGCETTCPAQVSLSSGAGGEQRPHHGKCMAIPRNKRIQMSDLPSKMKADKLSPPWGCELSALLSSQVPSLAHVPRSARTPSLLQTNLPFQGQVLFCCLQFCKAPHGSCHLTSLTKLLGSCASSSLRVLREQMVSCSMYP